MREVIIKQGVGVFPASGKKLLILLVPFGTVQRFSHVFKRYLNVTCVSLMYFCFGGWHFLLFSF